MRNKQKVRKQAPKSPRVIRWLEPVPTTFDEAVEIVRDMLQPDELNLLASFTQEGICGFHPLLRSLMCFIAANWLTSPRTPLAIDSQENQPVSDVPDEIAFMIIYRVWERLHDRCAFA